MHRIPNYGSVLQAYALQHKLSHLGYDSEYIDYVYPPPVMYTSFIVKLKLGLKRVILFLLGQKDSDTIPVIDEFRRTKLKCSACSYNKESIQDNPPIYDIYMSGSDQVWNPRFIGSETAFMLDFAPMDKPRLAYASSFATNEIPENLSVLYAKKLSCYRHITVREQSGVEIVKRLTEIDATVVCDPTLLLSREEWMKFSDKASHCLKGKYILVYVLGYMFDSRPSIYKIVKEMQKKMNLPVYYLGCTIKEMLQPRSKYISGLTPEEFVMAFRNASFVITDSFHGTAFASIFNIPMIGVVRNLKSGDGRLATLRKMVHGDKSLIECDTIPPLLQNGVEQYKCDEHLLDQFRDKSINSLERMVSDSVEYINKDI